MNRNQKIAAAVVGGLVLWVSGYLTALKQADKWTIHGTGIQAVMLNERTGEVILRPDWVSPAAYKRHEDPFADLDRK